MKHPVSLEAFWPGMGAGQGKLQLEGSDPLVDQLLVRNPTDPTSDVGSLLRLFDDTVHLFDFYGDRAEHSDDPRNPVYTLSGEGVRSACRRLDVLAKDYPANPNRDPDWIFGAPSILDQFTNTFESHEIQSIIVDATAGTFTLSYDGGITNTAPINWNETSSSTIETELEGLPQVTDVQVSGTGTNNDPFVVEHNDPTDPGTTLTANVGALTGTVDISLLTPGGTLTTGRWTISEDPVTGLNHGIYNFFGMSDAHPFGSQTYTLRWDGGTPAGAFSYTGVQTRAAVVPGRTYHGGCWIYCEGAASNIRIVIRDSLDETQLIASSTWPSTLIPANVWTWLPVPPFVMPDGVEDIIFRVATVDTGNPPPIHIAEPLLAPGVPAATYGDIIGQLLDHLATHRAAGTWLNRTFDAVNDSDANPWAGELSWDIGHGPDLETLFIHAEKRGYRSTVTWNGTGFDLNLYNPAATSAPLGGATTRTFLVDFKSAGTSSVNGRTVHAPAATTMIAEGPEGPWGEATDSTLAGKWGYRGAWWGDRIPRSSSDLAVAASQRLGDMNAGNAPFRVFAAAPNPNRRPGVDWQPGDMLDTHFPPRPRQNRRCEAITIRSSREGGDHYETHFGAVVYSGRGATVEAVNRLIRKTERLEPVKPRGLTAAGGGKTVPPIIAAPDSPALWQTAATFLTLGDLNDSQYIEDALNTGSKVFQLAPGTYYLNDVGTDPIIDVPNNVRIYVPSNMGHRGSPWQATFIPWNSNAGITWFRLGANAILEGVYVDDSSANTVAVELAGGGNQVVRNCWLAAGATTIKGTAAHDRLRIENSRLHAYNDSAPNVDLPFNTVALRIVNSSIDGGTHAVNLGSNSSGFVQFHIADCDIGGPTLDTIRAETSGLFGLSTIVNCELHGGAATGDSALIHLIGGNPANPENFTVGAHVHHNTLENGDRFGIWLEGADHTRIDGNLLEEIDRHGVFVDNTFHANLTGNVHRFTGRATGNTYDMIHLAGNTDNVTIRNDEFLDHPTSTRSRYAINVSAASVNGTAYLGNRFNGAGQTATVNDAGTGTINTYTGGALGDNI